MKEKNEMMYLICKEGTLTDDNKTIFIENLKNDDEYQLFRIAVDCENFEVADLILSSGFNLMMDNSIYEELFYYVDREHYNKVEYLIDKGISFTETLLTKIAIRYFENIQYHENEDFLNQIFELYYTEKNKTYQDVWGGY